MERAWVGAFEIMVLDSESWAGKVKERIGVFNGEKFVRFVKIKELMVMYGD